MPFEIDMLSVGDADAIIIRCTDQLDEHIILIDAGNAIDGEKVVNHINNWTDKSEIDLLIVTHAHDDHIGGLPTVLDKITIHEAFIHDPSTYAEQIRSLKTIATREQLEKATRSLSGLTSVISRIDSKGIPRREPFTGTTHIMPDGAVLTIAGPTEEYYSQLAPRIKAKTVETEMRADADLVDESDDTDPFNNSSVITVVEYDGRTYLFTADAGPASFLSAIASSPVALADVSWMQIPHHGSKRNVTSILIDHFCPDIAYVSATGNDSHPNPSVIRLFQKAGCAVYGTYKSGSLHHHRGELPPRPGYVTATPLDENAQ